MTLIYTWFLYVTKTKISQVFYDDYKRVDKCEDLKKIFKEYDGCDYKTVKEIYTKYQVSRQLLYYRYNRGWTPEEIVTYNKNAIIISFDSNDRDLALALAREFKNLSEQQKESLRTMLAMSHDRC